MESYADRENIGDRGSSQVYAPYVVTILQGITEYPSDAEVIYYSEESASHCRRLAKEADVVVIVAGNDYLDAVVVLVGGSMILMDEWKDQVGAILMAYYPEWKVERQSQMYYSGKRIRVENFHL